MIQSRIFATHRDAVLKSRRDVQLLHLNDEEFFQTVRTCSYNSSNSSETDKRDELRKPVSSNTGKIEGQFRCCEQWAAIPQHLASSVIAR